ncbi:UDP-2,3-diacylglucosamine hydrolase [Tatumella ptyseos ATCC 33301]|uniref:UDP-2,3-diacylglucosamine hydrolase n=1 Tax=Tatumella ptyseos ATCC 33301 TaxID=1005995 RepID=A0A085JB33_9GAMM|nr:UDP-2,3-diacylglucosamine diphosphatase [Tatumella ptyseos]KFD17679.1 UDP-2,3-diacylglucosamine hydrolase [Tatumella ptyseos ATCC 33301]
MSRTLFIADLHLCQQEPAITAGFLRFLQREATECEALYILGDLFESWIGDDDPNPLHQQVAEALSALTIPIWFIHGNRDFLLGKKFAARCGMQLLPEEQLLELYGHRVLIMHGDTLCTDDAGYLRFREKVHQPWLQRLFLMLPLRLRQKIAVRLRNDSQQANQTKSQQIMDVNPQAVEAVMQRYQASLLIHGHTHRPAIHRLSVGQQPAERAVLGAWHQEGSMIQLDADGVNLIAFPW